MDPNLSEKGSTFNIAMVLIAAAQVGPNADKIAKRTKLSRSVARKISARCREAKLFVGGKLHHGGWFDKKSGGTAFWLDVCCAEGLLRRADH